MSDDREDPDRDAILKRRHRLVALALAGLASGSAQACACLSPHVSHDAATADAGTDDGEDASTDEADASVSVDGGPMPCLAPPPGEG